MGLHVVFLPPDPSVPHTDTVLSARVAKGAWDMDGVIGAITVLHSAPYLIGKVSNNTAGMAIHPHTEGGFGFFPSSS